MTLKSTISLYIFFFLSLQTFVFAGSPDDPNSNPADTNKINSSSFSSFINSMDELGFKNIYFKQAPDDYKKIVSGKAVQANDPYAAGLEKSDSGSGVFTMKNYEVVVSAGSPMVKK